MSKLTQAISLSFVVSSLYISAAQASYYSVTDLGVSDIYYSVSNSGVLAGRELPDPSNINQWVPVVNQGGVKTYPSLPTGVSTGVVYDTNSSGAMVGTMKDGFDRAVSWDSSGLHVLPLQNSSQRQAVAFGVNDQGDIVGRIATPGLGNAPILWKDGQVIDLRNGDASYQAVARDINNNGTIVGVADYTNQYGELLSIATTWAQGERHALSNLSGASYSDAKVINDGGLIGGYSNFSSSSGIFHLATLWQNNQALDLNSFIDPLSGWVLNTVTALNDVGTIVGTGTYNGASHAFSMNVAEFATPVSGSGVPEPGALAVLGSGLAGLSWLSRRRKAVARRAA